MPTVDPGVDDRNPDRGAAEGLRPRLRRVDVGAIDRRARPWRLRRRRRIIEVPLIREARVVRHLVRALDRVRLHGFDPVLSTEPADDPRPTARIGSHQDGRQVG
jgi:hypothetical protein